MWGASLALAFLLTVIVAFGERFRRALLFESKLSLLNRGGQFSRSIADDCAARGNEIVVCSSILAPIGNCVRLPQSEGMPKTMTKEGSKQERLAQI